MTTGPLLSRMLDRIELDKQEGDIAYLNALLYQLEYLAKLVTGAVVAGIEDDGDRHRYSLEHRLIRSDSIGEWVAALDEALTGPAAISASSAFSTVRRELIERVSEDAWQYQSVRSLADAAKHLGLDVQLGAKIALRQFFQISATIRNRSRGHGATTALQCSDACPHIASAINTLVDNLTLFKASWVYLHRNLSGKYRVSPMLGDGHEFESLKRDRETSLQNGTYIHLLQHFYVPIVYSDPEIRDVRLPNGAFKNGFFETLSYITNDTIRESASPWHAPPGQLPPSDTEGAPALDQFGNLFSNAPKIAPGYIRRRQIEEELVKELVQQERHPILSLTGPGGIGKTSVTLAAIEKISQEPTPPYEVVIWLSARDIDLNDSGPKKVSRRVSSRQDILDQIVDYLELKGRGSKEFNAEAYVNKCLREPVLGKTLFVFDNFETLENPSDVYQWIDTHLRLPNKALITTRFRDFNGDFPIAIGGMREEEALELIQTHGRRLGIEEAVSAEYAEKLISESDGHPYVIKVLLGEMAKQQRPVNPQRIVASADNILAALFERTYGRISPAAQRIFLLLGSWRAFVPRVAVEAISLRPENERFDVAGAIDELIRFSLVDSVTSESDAEEFVGVSLAALNFGAKKIESSPFKKVIEEDRKLLMLFGAGKRAAAHRGALPRVQQLIRSVARNAPSDETGYERAKPILEYLAMRIPMALPDLSELAEECDDLDSAKRYMTSFVEDGPVDRRCEAWQQLARLNRVTRNSVGELQSLCSAVEYAGTVSEKSRLVNLINGCIREVKADREADISNGDITALLQGVANQVERDLNGLSSDDCSRLAWLYLNMGNNVRARDIAEKGLRKDSQNYHCVNLLRKLGE
jgi:hypothetical protein